MSQYPVRPLAASGTSSQGRSSGSGMGSLRFFPYPQREGPGCRSTRLVRWLLLELRLRGSSKGRWVVRVPGPRTHQGRATVVSEILEIVHTGTVSPPVGGLHQGLGWCFRVRAPWSRSKTQTPWFSPCSREPETMKRRADT